VQASRGHRRVSAPAERLGAGRVLLVARAPQRERDDAELGRRHQLEARIGRQHAFGRLGQQDAVLDRSSDPLEAVGVKGEPDLECPRAA